MIYFAYGSNMDKEQMVKRGINFISRKFAKLPGYVLVFNKKAQAGDFAYANITESDSGYVEGIIYEFPDNDIIRLDKAEGYPNHYFKKEIIVFDKYEEPIQATAYIAQSDKIVECLYPKTEYLNHLLAGKDLLSESYFEKLLNTQTI
jgi:gamma-glutamylcyclotransferase (GGCT)/AIG2-like uncharacterized protein YtfP